MSDFSLSDYSHLVRFFEKLVEWLGIPRNAGPILTALYVSKYKRDEKMSADDLVETTRYSRSNIGLIVSQLEAIGLIISEVDYGQTGRGRRRILYTVDEKVNSLISMIVKKTMSMLEEISEDIDTLQGLYSDAEPYIVKMLKAFKEETEQSLASLGPILKDSLKK